MAKSATDWAVEPLLGIPAAAKVLGLSPRTLSDVLKEYPCYQRGGRAYAFYPEHIKQGERLRPLGHSSEGGPSR